MGVISPHSPEGYNTCVVLFVFKLWLSRGILSHDILRILTRLLEI